MSKEREITVRIKELLRYRKNGINNLQESESYEAEREKRNTGKADRKKALEREEALRRIQMIEMQNVCNCFTIQSDLVKQLIGLTQMKNEDEKMKFNYILIKALGVTEPHEIARYNWDAERRVLILKNKKLKRKRRKSLKKFNGWLLESKRR